MKKILTLTFLAAGLFITSQGMAQDDKKKENKDQKNKTEEVVQPAQQDTTKKKPTGTRMAINSAGLPTKGNKDTKNTSNNRTVNDPKADPKKDAKKEDQPK